MVFCSNCDAGLTGLSCCRLQLKDLQQEWRNFFVGGHKVLLQGLQVSRNLIMSSDRVNLIKSLGTIVHYDSLVIAARNLPIVF